MDLIKTLSEETLAETYPGPVTAEDLVDDLSQSFNPDGLVIKGHELPQILICYAEQTIEPVGWQAIWRCGAQTLARLSNSLSSPALVEVFNVDYETLEALVEPIEEDVKRQVTVLLTDLYPLVRQENEAVNVEATHMALQKIRFFQNQLSFPWDSELEGNWFEEHLPPRVQIFCDARGGLLSKEIAVRYRCLLSEADSTEKRLQTMAAKAAESDEEMDDESVVRIAELNAKLEEIQHDVEIILNPATRMLLFGSKETPVRDENQPELLLVVKGLSCHKLHQVISRVEKEFNPQQNLKCYPSLQTALDDAMTNDVILLPAGIHSLLNLNALRHGGTLIGVASVGDVVVHLGCSSEVGLSFELGRCTIKSCTILVNNRQTGISVKGELLLRDCVIKGPEAEHDYGMGSAWKGFYLTPHSRLSLTDCTVANFDVGLRVRSAAHVVLLGCKVEYCNIAILAEQKAFISFTDSELKNCRENAIVVEMDPCDGKETILGSNDLLQLIPETVYAKDLRCYANGYNVKLEY